MKHLSTFFIRPSVNMSEDVNPLTGERPRYRIAIPETGDYLPDDGATMPRSGFWLRRLRDNDVEIVEELSVQQNNATTKAPLDNTITPEEKSITAKKNKENV